MPQTPAQARATQKWNKEHMKLIGCKIKKEYADEFEQYATDRGTTRNALIREFIYSCIGVEEDDYILKK